MVDLAKAPASGAGPGVESPRLDYRKSDTHLHPYVSALSDGRDRFRVGPSSEQRLAARIVNYADDCAPGNVCSRWG